MSDEAGEFYEIEIDGVVRRISRRQMDELAAEILVGEGSLTERMAAAFGDHPHVDTEAIEEPEPSGVDEEEDDEEGDAEDDEPWQGRPPP